MGGSRSQARKRAAHRSQSSHPSPQDISTLAARLSEELPQPPSSSLKTALKDLAEAPTPSNQVAVGEALCSSPNPRTAVLRQRVAQLALSLPAWYTSAPAPALSLFSEIAIAACAKPSPRDTSALTTSLQGLSRAAVSALRTPPARATIPALLPSLSPVLHSALFRPRPAPVADTFSASDSATSSASSATHPRLERARLAALDALIALAESAPAAPLPLVQALLPDRPGTPSSGRESLTTLILFDPDASIRSKAVSAATALLQAARLFLRHVTTVPPTRRSATSTAFTPSSIRILSAAAALYPAVATAILQERHAVTVAKLARLASKLAASAPVPSVDVSAVQGLSRALCARVRDAKGTDRTSRAAIASALAVAVSKSGSYIAEEDLNLLSTELVVIVHHRQEDPELPLVEVLGILRSVVAVRPQIFVTMFKEKEFPMVELSERENKPEVLLHLIRLVAAFIVQSAGSFDQTPKSIVRQELELAWRVYHTIFKAAAGDQEHPAQCEAVYGVGDVLRFSSAATDCHLRNWGSSVGEQKVQTGWMVDQARQMREGVQLLSKLTSVAWKTSVRTSALVALSCVSPNKMSATETERLLELLHGVVTDTSNEASVRGKAMTSFLTIIDKVVNFGEPVSGRTLCMVNSAAESAVSFLRLSQREENKQSNAKRSSTESSKIAALNMVSFALCYMHKGDGLSTEQEASLRSRNLLVSVLTDVLLDEESLNIKCICCKSIGSILRAPSLESARRSWEKAEGEMVQALQRCLVLGPIRLQVAAAKGIQDAIAAQKSFLAVSLPLLLRMFERTTTRLGEGTIEAKLRAQLLNLLEIIRASTFSLVLDMDNDRWQEIVSTLVSMENSSKVGSALTACVCQHLHLPHTIADQILSGERPSDSTRWMSHEVLLDSLSEDAHAVLRRVTALWEAAKT